MPLQKASTVMIEKGSSTWMPAQCSVDIKANLSAWLSVSVDKAHLNHWQIGSWGLLSLAGLATLRPTVKRYLARQSAYRYSLFQPEERTSKTQQKGWPSPAAESFESQHQGIFLSATQQASLSRLSRGNIKGKTPFMNSSYDCIYFARLMTWGLHWGTYHWPERKGEEGQPHHKKPGQMPLQRMHLRISRRIWLHQDDGVSQAVHT